MVSCPGVWLCPKGDAMLRVSMLGASAHTKRVDPSFPLLFHQSFHFRKTFTGITTLAALQAELTKRMVHIQLVQWQVHGCRCVLLAAFRSPLSELLYPQPVSRHLVAGVDVDLLMETTSCFPGIIAPKVEISTKVVIEEMVNYPLHDENSVTINHKTVPSKKTGSKSENKPEGKFKVKTKSTLSSGYNSRLRQKPVCHARPRVKCYYCKQRVERARRLQAQCDCVGEQTPGVKEDPHYVPYCNKCGDVVEEKEVKQGKIILKESSQHTGKWEAKCPCVEPPRSKSACDCGLCRKYQDLFNSSLPDSARSQNSKSPRRRFDRSPSPPKKEKCCSCCDKPGDAPPRLRAGTAHGPTWNLSVDDNCESASEGVRRGAAWDEEYRNLLKADLDTRYKQLYERVSRRSNRRQS